MLRLTHKEAVALGFEEPRQKYHNEPITVDGIKFGSQLEARRYGELRIRERVGEITNLKPHPKFRLVVRGHKICWYTADSEYYENGERVVEDVKSDPTRTRAYRLRVKLMWAIYKIKVREFTG